MSSFAIPPCISAYIVRHTSEGPRYLLIRRCCGGYLNGTWQMVTGRTIGTETATQTALREIREETGLTPDKFYFADAVETFYICNQNKTIVVPVFVAFVEEPNVCLSPEEHDAFEWLSFEEARNRLLWAEQQRTIAHVHERFLLKKPSDHLLINPTQHPTSKLIVSRTGIYGIALQNQKILLVKQQRGPNREKLDLPGGKIEVAETIEEALQREFREEVGMTFNSMQLMENVTTINEGVNANGTPFSIHQIGLIYLINGLTMLQNQTPEMEYFWISLEQLPTMAISPFVEQMLPKIFSYAQIQL